VVAVAVTAPQGGGDRTERFVQEALAQAGDRYVFGGETRLDDANPKVFDCSELVQWAAHRAGVDVSDGSWLQYLQLQQQGGAISVEQALHTRGALLFYFSDAPTRAGRPRAAHVAISLGDGRTIEARSPADGVGSFAATAKRFNYAATIPGLSAAAADPPDDPAPPVPGVSRAAAAAYTIPDAPLPGAAPTDTTPAAGGDPVPKDPAQKDPAQSDADADGLTAKFEALLGTDPLDPDTDDDGLTDAQEAAVEHTDPLDADTDDDGRSDAEEVTAGTDPGTVALPEAAVNAGYGGLQTVDTDEDGLSDAFERLLGTRFDVADSDSDSVPDGVEEAMGANPLSIDGDQDGITDDLEFQAGTLGPATSGGAEADVPGGGGLQPDLDGAGLDHPT
jgi:NlpC/P60 family protein/thrombospondin type 3 repeat protein